VAQSAQAAQQAGGPSVNAVAFDIAAVIFRQQPLARDEGGNLYRYQDGVYVPEVNDLRLRQVIAREVVKAHGKDYLNRHLEEEILHRLMVEAGEIEARPNPWLLNVLNGTIDLRKPGFPLLSHDPARRTTVQLPVEYVVGAECPKVEEFFGQVFPPDAIADGVPLALVALCSGAYPGIDKAILLLGEGENGKGVMLDVVKAFIGHANCCAVPLQRMGEDRFATSDLRGKLLNICSDLPSKRLEDSGDFKAIVSGEMIRAQRKNKPAFDFTPFCRLLFSANVLPESADTSWGYFRRWYIVPFTQSFGPENPQRGRSCWRNSRRRKN
jgi:putative DNA primase/helicase